MTVYPPGTRFEYSNIGMKILDAAIEHVSKRTMRITCGGRSFSRSA
jgi:CubicO group peptidase (beta-lactamase class C family)